MADQDAAPTSEESGAGANGESWSNDTPTLEKIRIERDRAMKATKAAEAAAKEANARLAKIEEEQQRASGELSKVIETRDKELDSLRAKLSKMEKAEEDRVRSDRTSSLLDAVVAKTGATNRATLAALLRGVAERTSIDVAPTEVTDTGVESVVDGLRSLYPEYFSGLGEGGSPGSPGLNKQTKEPGQEPGGGNKGKALAERFNRARQQSG